MICISLVLLAGTSFIFLLRLPVFQISNVQVEGSTISSSSSVLALAKDSLAGNYPFFIPRSNIIFFPKRDIEESLKNSFAEIKSITTERKGLSFISLSIKERMASALVCEGFIGDSVYGGNCFLADNEAFVFAKAKENLPNLAKYYIINDKEEGIIGTRFVEKVDYQDLSLFVEESMQAGIVPLGVLVSGNGQYEMYVKRPIVSIENASSSPISPPFITVYFDKRTPFSKTLSNLIAFWTTLFKKENNLIGSPSIDFINLRHGNTIFYSAQ